ncbi:restriction endonuclease subunit S [Brevibacterium antiquum]|uniref:Type I restriction enzyme, S subunit n=1 Tax=Brevibacterium antiquum TaxID=234835 RepID=A0A2H1IIU0_9MICO|nr:restriction endonuclease subunit S [Brevibacterium antiquum]SMX74892.1 type I restriction enzyme, S subunit [Brevibacterium antiquum]
MKTVPLGEVASIARSTIKPDEIHDDTKYVGLEHIEKSSGKLRPSAAGDANLTSTKHRFSSSQILYGKLRPYLAKIAVPDFSGVCSTDILPISPGNDVDRSYLYHFLTQPTTVADVAGKTTGANLPRIKPEALTTLILPLPPLDEQRRIAAILDKADAIRQKRRQAITHLDTLTQSIFDEMFLTGQSWKTSTLDTMADIASGITKGRKTNGTALMQTPYLAVANVQDGYLDLTNVKQIDATAAEIERYKLLPGDLVLTEGGDPDKLGRGSVWDGEIESCIHQNHIFRVRLQPTSLFSPSFLSRYLSTTEAKKYFLKSAKQTTGIASINKTQLSKFPVPLVPIAEQTKFAHYQAILSRKIVASIEALSTADALFASLQSRAFQGEL